MSIEPNGPASTTETERQPSSGFASPLNWLMAYTHTVWGPPAKPLRSVLKPCSAPEAGNRAARSSRIWSPGTAAVIAPSR